MPVAAGRLAVRLLALALGLAGCSGGGGAGGPGPAGDLVAEVDEEVLLVATDLADLGALDAAHARYAWDLGDGLDEPARGIAITHAWSRPGTFTVTLTVTPGVLAGGAWTFPGPALIFTRACVVTGARPALPPLVSAQPLLRLAFDGDLADGSGHGRTATWGAGAGTFAPGIDGGQALDVSGGRYVRVAGAGAFLGGRSGFTVSFWARRTATGDANTHFLGLRDSAAGDVLRFAYVDGQSQRAVVRTGVQAYAGNYAWNVARTAHPVWLHYALTYDAASRTLIIYVDGLEEGRATVAGDLFTADGDLLVGADGTGAHAFEGWLDDFRIYGQALSARDLTTGLEVRHAPFHARSAQYVEVRLPEAVTADPGHRLRLAVSGGGLPSELVLLDQAGPAATERALLRTGQLPGSPREYTLSASVLSASGQVLLGRTERFRKPYDGDPAVGIDENDALLVGGAPRFPITSWGLNNADVASWADAGFINTLYGTAFWPRDLTVAEYAAYLDLGLQRGLSTIGPASFAGQLGASGGVNWRQNTSPGSLATYLQALRDHPGVLAWQWADEPDLNDVDAPTVRAWTVVSHREDPQHPVATNYMGGRYVGGQDAWGFGATAPYVYERNASTFGKRLHVTDVTGFDYYPVAAAAGGDAQAVAELADALDHLRDRNGGLVPFMSWVETTDAVPDDGHAVKPTAAQLEMLAWVNVVHGAKGINWFHYFGPTPPENLAVMAAFTARMAALAPVVLDADPGLTATVAAGGGARVDTLVRVHGGKAYVFAVRLSEMQPTADGSAVEAVDPSTWPVTIQVPGGVAGPATVLGEGRTVEVTGGAFSDAFAPFAVHLYELPLS